MKVKSLISLLQQFDGDSEVLCPIYNGYTETYGVIDYAYEDYFERTVYNDLYGTPGMIDGRLMTKEMINPNNKIVYIGSDFLTIHGVGDNDINYNIQELNDDPNWLWEHNGFELINDEDCEIFYQYLKEFTEADEDGNFEYEMINYYKDKYENWYTCELHCRRNTMVPSKMVTLINPGLEEIRNAMEFLGFEKTLMT